jgi:putative RecB family exonuclease
MALETPRSLSPSKVSAFTDCPLAFRLSIIDRLPEAPSAAAVKGTLVHSALERLFWDNEKGARTPEAARHALDGAWQELQGDSEFAGLALGAEDAAAFVADAQVLIDNYFALEDPNAVTTLAVELGLEVDLGTMRLRGIIDRLDLTDDGQLVVVDYKTGRAPSLRFEHGKLTGVHIYALLCEAMLGRAPVEVRLLHLRDPVSITAVPSEQSLRGQARRTTAVWNAIERACATEDFRPRPSSLCRFCSFQSICPAFAGDTRLEVAS